MFEYEYIEFRWLQNQLLPLVYDESLKNAARCDKAVFR